MVRGSGVGRTGARGGKGLACASGNSGGVGGNLVHGCALEERRFGVSYCTSKRGHIVFADGFWDCELFFSRTRFPILQSPDFSRGRLGAAPMSNTLRLPLRPVNVGSLEANLMRQFCCIGAVIFP